MNIQHAIRIFLFFNLLLVISTQGKLDPTPMNLIYPYEGIKNWLGLPGALLGGFLLEQFGLCAYLFPFYILFIEFSTKLKMKWKLLFPLFHIFILNLFIALLFSGNSEVFFSNVGFIGSAACSILLVFPGKIISLLILLIGIVLITQHIHFNFFIFSYILKYYYSIVAFSKKSISLLFKKYQNRKKLNLIYKVKSWLYKKEYSNNNNTEQTVKKENAPVSEYSVFQKALLEYQKEHPNSSLDALKKEEQSTEKMFHDLVEEEEK